jgi:hypothetical protein
MDVSGSRNFPNTDRLSMLAAMIMLAYALNRFMEIPPRTIQVQLPGLFIAVEINDSSITALLVAGLTAVGVDWLLRDHPAHKNQRIIPHILLPAITALIIGIPLNRLSFGLGWWAGLLAGTSLLVLVIVAEYIAMDPLDLRQPLASAGLSAVTFAIFLILASTLRAAGARLIFLLPAIGIVTWLVCLRSLHLRLHGEWAVYESAIVSLLVIEVAAAIHYWPLSPIRFGLLCLGPAYALTSLFNGMIEEKQIRELIVEPLVVLIVAWIGAVILV